MELYEPCEVEPWGLFEIYEASCYEARWSLMSLMKWSPMEPKEPYEAL